jgi:hypothetical protein
VQRHRSAIQSGFAIRLRMPGSFFVSGVSLPRTMPGSGRALSPLSRGRSRLAFPTRRRAISALTGDDRFCNRNPAVKSFRISASAPGPVICGGALARQRLSQSGRTGGASTVVIPEWAAFAQNVAYHLLVGPKAERGRNKSLRRASPSSDHQGCPR